MSQSVSASVHWRVLYSLHFTDSATFIVLEGVFRLSDSTSLRSFVIWDGEGKLSNWMQMEVTEPSQISLTIFGTHVPFTNVHRTPNDSTIFFAGHYSQNVLCWYFADWILFVINAIISPMMQVMIPFWFGSIEENFDVGKTGESDTEEWWQSQHIMTFPVIRVLTWHLNVILKSVVNACWLTMAKNAQCLIQGWIPSASTSVIMFTPCYAFQRVVTTWWNAWDACWGPGLTRMSKAVRGN